MPAARRRGPPRWLAVIGVLALVACAPLPPEARRDAPRSASAPPPPPQHDVPSWALAELLATDATAVGFRRGQQLVAVLPVPALRAMARATERMTHAAAYRLPDSAPEFRVIAGESPNAFAIQRPAAATVAVNFGMVGLLGEDEAMWAAVLGHELAHLKRQHQQVRLERSERGESLSSLAAVLLSFAGVPFAPVLTDATAGMVRLGYSREDELEADALALDYLAEAGYDPRAALRFHELLAQQTADTSGGLLSTHPAGSERVEAIRRRLAQLPTR